MTDQDGPKTNSDEPEPKVLAGCSSSQESGVSLLPQSPMNEAGNWGESDQDLFRFLIQSSHRYGNRDVNPEDLKTGLSGRDIIRVYMDLFRSRSKGTHNKWEWHTDSGNLYVNVIGFGWVENRERSVELRESTAWDDFVEQDDLDKVQEALNKRLNDLTTSLRMHFRTNTKPPRPVIFTERDYEEAPSGKGLKIRGVIDYDHDYDERMYKELNKYQIVKPDVILSDASKLWRPSYLSSLAISDEARFIIMGLAWQRDEMKRTIRKQSIKFDLVTRLFSELKVKYIMYPENWTGG
jgi:hypothetical protein